MGAHGNGKRRHVGYGFYAVPFNEDEIRAQGLDVEWATIKALDAAGKYEEAQELYQQRIARKKAEGRLDKELDDFLSCFK